MNAFEPITLSNLTLKNRFVRSATHDYMQQEDGLISEDQLDLYKQLALNEVGMIITGHLYVSSEGRASADQNSIANDEVLPNLIELVKRVIPHGSAIIAQLAHAGAKARVDRPVGPSPLTLRDDVTCHELTIEEIEQIKESFILAALRAKKAGFTGVQVHMAHGYLLSEFTTPEHNWRTDQYGQTVENRFRLGRDIILGIKEACGKDYPVFVKINSNVVTNDEAYEQDLVYILNQCHSLNVEAVELSGCDLFQKKRPDHLYYLERAARLKQQVEIPLILVGGIRTLEDVNQVLAAGIELVSMSRPFICEPDLIQRFKEEHDSKCLTCNGCYGLYYRKGKKCVLHPNPLNRSHEKE